MSAMIASALILWTMLGHAERVIVGAWVAAVLALAALAAATALAPAVDVPCHSDRHPALGRSGQPVEVVTTVCYADGPLPSNSQERE